MDMPDLTVPSPSSLPPQPAAWWQLGATAVDLGGGQVQRTDGQGQRLDRGALAVLSRLLAQPGSTVNKAELLQAGWPGRVVTENSLAKAIARLRQALDDAEGKVIVSVHGYGYRAVPSAACTHGSAGASGAAGTAVSASPTTAAIGSAPDIALASATSVLSVPVRRAAAPRPRPGRRAAILLCLAVMSVLWVYLGQRGGAQDVAPRAVSDRPLESAAGTQNPAAYRAYLQGNTLYRSDDGNARRALQAFRNAVALDPLYDRAWLRIVDILSHNGFWADGPAEALAGKREALHILDALLQRAPQTIEAWITRGALKHAHWWDWAGAEADFHEAERRGGGAEVTLALNRARMAAARGDIDQALVLARRADVLDPRGQAGASLQGYLLLATGRRAQARLALARAIGADALDEHAHYYLGLCALQEQQFDAARSHFEHSAHVLRLTGLAVLEHQLGRTAAADQALEVLIRRYAQVAAFRVAQVHAARADTAQALAWLERSLAQHEAALMFLGFDPLLDSVRSEPRFARLLARVSPAARAN